MVFSSNQTTGNEIKNAISTPFSQVLRNAVNGGRLVEEGAHAALLNDRSVCALVSAQLKNPKAVRVQSSKTGGEKGAAV